MKNILLLLLVIPALFSCKKDDKEYTSSNYVLGKWKLVVSPYDTDESVIQYFYFDKNGSFSRGWKSDEDVSGSYVKTETSIKMKDKYKDQFGDVTMEKTHELIINDITKNEIKVDSWTYLHDISSSDIIPDGLDKAKLIRIK